jgi:ankyrin repeat protein
MSNPFEFLFATVLGQLKDESSVPLSSPDHGGGASALYSAINTGSLEDVRRLVVDDQVNINAVFNDNFTPIFIAVWKGYEDIVKLLIENKCDIEAAENPRKQTPLYCAAFDNKLKIVKALVAADFAKYGKNSAYIDKETSDGSTPLAAAAYFGYPDVERVLIDAGANVPNGETPLLRTANAKNGHVKDVKANLRKTKGGDTAQVQWAQEVLDGENDKALLVAAKNGDVKNVKALLGTGASANATDSKGRTALWLAAFNGNLEVAQDLISARAEVDRVTGEHGETALNAAAGKGHVKIVEALLSAGADANKNDTKGRTALCWAAFNGNLEVAQALIRKSAEVDKVGEHGETALIVAAEIIRKSAEVDKVGEHGETALIVAAEKGHVKIVEALLGAGANVNHRDEGGITPIKMAVQNDHKEVVKVLLDAGANVNHGDKGGITPIKMAVQNDPKEVVKVLAARAEVNNGEETKTPPDSNQNGKPRSSSLLQAIRVANSGCIKGTKRDLTGKCVWANPKSKKNKKGR